MRQTVRITGAILIGAGLLGLVWALVVWKWQDPITALYTTYEQHTLAESYDDGQLIQATMLVGYYHVVAFVTNALGTPLEPGAVAY